MGGGLGQKLFMFTPPPYSRISVGWGETLICIDLELEIIIGFCQDQRKSYLNLIQKKIAIFKLIMFKII